MAKPTPLDAALVAASIGGGLVAYKRGKSEGKSEVKKAMTPNKIAGLRRAASRPDGNSWLRRYASSRLEQASVGQGIKNPLYMRRDPTFGAQVRSRGRNARTRTEQYGPTPNPTRLGTPMRPLP